MRIAFFFDKQTPNNKQQTTINKQQTTQTIQTNKQQQHKQYKQQQHEHTIKQSQTIPHNQFLRPQSNSFGNEIINLVVV